MLCRAVVFRRPTCTAQLQELQDLHLSFNNLSGPAFPPAWLAPGALPSLAVLHLAGNAGLTGTLPPSMPWPKLSAMWVWFPAERCWHACLRGMPP